MQPSWVVNKLPFGIIAKKNDKIINFMRDVQFNAVINRKQKILLVMYILA